MSPLDVTQTDDIVTSLEGDIKQVCSPFSGNCFEVALALRNVFGSESPCRFLSIFSDPEHVAHPETYPNVGPRHIAVEIDGSLFDAGGLTDESQLLREYVPWKQKGRDEHIRYDPTFQYHEITTGDTIGTLTDIYRQGVE
jgi:hypothetical protein